MIVLYGKYKKLINKIFDYPLCFSSNSSQIYLPIFNICF